MKNFDPIIGTLEAAIRARNQRHDLITSNLANADTPGYRAKDLQFESQLKAMLDHKGAQPAGTMARTAGSHLGTNGTAKANSIGTVEEKPASSGTGPDGNGVSRDEEVARMAENQMLYRASTKAIARHFALLRYAISEGGR